jgi:SAM-dependent methyltransferase
VSVDHYAGAGQRWAAGAELVYAPIAHELVAPHADRLQGRLVVDLGAGTGVAARELTALGARPICLDLSPDMLAAFSTTRPPCVVGDVDALPFGGDAAHATVAAFVLNHLTDPQPALREIARVTRPGGLVLACVYANSSRSAPRDAVDEAARAGGWEPPHWYVDLKARATPLLGTAEAMAASARAAGLADVVTDERAIDTGVTEPDQLVAYRFGQAQFSSWIDGLTLEQAQQVRRSAAEAARPLMEPYRPTVVLLAGSAPTGSDRGA